MRLHGRHKILLVVFSSIVLLVIYFIVQAHFSYVKSSKIEVLSRLKAISYTASLQVDGDKLRKLQRAFLRKDDITDSGQDTLYRQIHDQLKRIYQINDLESPVYTMVYDAKLQRFQFLVTSAERPYYRHDYELFPGELLENYEKGGILDSYEDENGRWLSAYAPVKDSNGSTVALLQVDESISFFIQKSLGSLARNTLLALVILIPFSMLLYSFVNRTLRAEEESRKFLEEKNEEIRLQSELIKLNNDKLEEAKNTIEARNRSLDKQVKKRTHDLLKANKDLETFLYRSSHDIQGPISTLKGLCTIAQYDVRDPQTQSLIRMINQSANRLIDRIKSINAIYQIKSKKLKREVFELREVLDHIKKQFRYEIENASINLRMENISDITLNTDREILTLAVGELIKNAIQHGATDSSPEIVISAEKQNDSLKLSVIDNGGNINPAVKNRIFKMFQRGTHKSMGAGLGLYAVRLALGKLDGTVQLSAYRSSVTQFDLSLAGV